jgi:hypothetical protein
MQNVLEPGESHKILHCEDYLYGNASDPSVSLSYVVAHTATLPIPFMDINERPQGKQLKSSVLLAPGHASDRRKGN